MKLIEMLPQNVDKEISENYDLVLAAERLYEYKTPVGKFRRLRREIAIDLFDIYCYEGVKNKEFTDYCRRVGITYDKAIKLVKKVIRGVKKCMVSMKAERVSLARRFFDRFDSVAFLSDEDKQSLAEGHWDDDLPGLVSACAKLLTIRYFVRNSEETDVDDTEDTILKAKGWYLFSSYYEEDKWYRDEMSRVRNAFYRTLMFANQGRNKLDESEQLVS